MDLTNAYPVFEALTNHSLAYQCWLWVKYPRIVTDGACMALGISSVTSKQLEASRPQQEIGVDLMPVLLVLSMLSSALSWEGGWGLGST